MADLRTSTETPRSVQRREIREKRLQYFCSSSHSAPMISKTATILTSNSRNNSPASTHHSSKPRPANHSSPCDFGKVASHSGNSGIQRNICVSPMEQVEFDSMSGLTTHRPELDMLDTSRTSDLLVETTRGLHEVLQERRVIKTQEECGGVSIHSKMNKLSVSEVLQQLKNKEHSRKLLINRLQNLCDDDEFDEEESSVLDKRENNVTSVSNNLKNTAIRHEEHLSEIRHHHKEIQKGTPINDLTGENLNQSFSRQSLDRYFHSVEQLWPLRSFEALEFAHQFEPVSQPYSREPDFSLDHMSTHRSVNLLHDDQHEYAPGVDPISREPDFALDHMSTHRSVNLLHDDQHAYEPGVDPISREPDFSLDRMSAHRSVDLPVKQSTVRSNFFAHDEDLHVHHLEQYLMNLGINGVHSLLHDSADFHLEELEGESSDVGIQCPDCKVMVRTKISWCVNCGCCLVGLNEVNMNTRPIRTQLVVDKPPDFSVQSNDSNVAIVDRNMLRSINELTANCDNYFENHSVIVDKDNGLLSDRSLLTPQPSQGQPKRSALPDELRQELRLTLVNSSADDDSVISIELSDDSPISAAPKKTPLDNQNVVHALEKQQMDSLRPDKPSTSSNCGKYSKQSTGPNFSSKTASHQKQVKVANVQNTTPLAVKRSVKDYRQAPARSRHWQSHNQVWCETDPANMRKPPADYVVKSYNENKKYNASNLRYLKETRQKSSVTPRIVKSENNNGSDSQRCQLPVNLSTTSHSNHALVSATETPAQQQHFHATNNDYNSYGNHEKHKEKRSQRHRSNSYNQRCRPYSSSGHRSRNNSTSSYQDLTSNCSSFRVNLQQLEEAENTFKPLEMSPCAIDTLSQNGWNVAESPWIYLPEEIWLCVLTQLGLSDLSRVASVCRRLHRIAHDPSLWRRLVLTRQHDLTNGRLAALGRHKPRELHLKQCHGDHVTLQGMKELFAEAGESLERLVFTGCSRGGFQGDQLLLLSAVFCQRLRQIDCSFAQNVRDATVAALAEASLKLESLQLNGAQNLTDEAVRILAYHHSSTLLHLELYGCFNITDHSLRTLGSTCIQLRRLSLGSCPKLSSAALAQCVTHLTHLEALDLRGMSVLTDACVEVIATSCPKLEDLVVANCAALTGAALRSLAYRLGGRLRNLDLCGCSGLGQAESGGLCELARRSPHLETLDLSSTAADNAALLALTKYCASSLRELKLNFCRNLSNDVLIKLADSAHRLRLVQLFGTSGVTCADQLRSAHPTLRVDADL